MQSPPGMRREEGWALLRSNYQKGLVWVLRCLLEVVFGMEYLHSLSIVHGDLKCANVLCKSSTSDPRGFACKARPSSNACARFHSSRQHGLVVGMQRYGTAASKS